MNKLQNLGLWAAMKSLQLAQNIVSKNNKIKPFAKNLILLGINRAIASIEALRDGNENDEEQIKQILIGSVAQPEFDFILDAAVTRATTGIKNPSLQIAVTNLLGNGKSILKLLADENQENEAQIRAYLAAYWKSAASTDDILLALDGLLAKIRAKDPLTADIIAELLKAVLEEIKN
jgi:hypothetical protein